MDFFKDGNCIRTSAYKISYKTYFCLVWASHWFSSYSSKKTDVLARELLAPIVLLNTSAMDLPMGKIGLISDSYVISLMVSGAGRAGTMAEVLGPVALTSGALGTAKIGWGGLGSRALLWVARVSPSGGVMIG